MKKVEDKLKQLIGDTDMSNDEEKPNVISYEELVPKEDFDLPLLTKDLVGKSFEITDVIFRESQFGEYAVVTTDKGVYRVSSTVILSQLHIIVKALEKDYEKIKVKLKQEKRYFTF